MSESKTPSSFSCNVSKIFFVAQELPSQALYPLQSELFKFLQDIDIFPSREFKISPIFISLGAFFN